MPTTGDRIKELRERRGWTLDRLAQETKISKGFLSEVENDKGKGNIGAANLLKIANALGASLDYLVRGESGHEERERAPVTIPRALSEAAQTLHLTYAQTLTLVEAHEAVIARRSARVRQEPTVQDWINLWNAIRQVYPDAPESED